MNCYFEHYDAEELNDLFLHLLQSPEHKIAFLQLAHIVAKADGFVARNERGYLRAFMEEMEIYELEAPLEEDLPLEALAERVRDEQARNIFIAEILLLVFADGRYDEKERRIVADLKRAFGYSEAGYEAIKDWVIRMDRLRTEGVKLILDPSWQTGDNR